MSISKSADSQLFGQGMPWRYGRRLPAGEAQFYPCNMVAGADHGDSFIRDMGYSRKEFFRILPAALAGFAYIIEGNRVIISNAGSSQQLQLTVKALPDREIGMIRIPRIEVEFAFSNFSAEERKKFMGQFDQSYQRGGG